VRKKMNEEQYSVGYKKPPRHTQFAPGRSGNPKGRPKKVATLPDILSKELRARVPIISNGKRRKVTMLEAIVKQYLNKAAGGDSKAAALVFSQLRESNSGAGDNLSELVQEFRALHTRHVAADHDARQLTGGEVSDGKEGV
jgi:hypothetical protein